MATKKLATILAATAAFVNLENSTMPHNFNPKFNAVKYKFKKVRKCNNSKKKKKRK